MIMVMPNTSCAH